MGRARGWGWKERGVEMEAWVVREGDNVLRLKDRKEVKSQTLSSV